MAFAKSTDQKHGINILADYLSVAREIKIVLYREYSEFFKLLNEINTRLDAIKSKNKQRIGVALKVIEKQFNNLDLNATCGNLDGIRESEIVLLEFAVEEFEKLFSEKKLMR